MKQFQLDHGLAFIGLGDDESAAASLGVYGHMGALPLSLLTVIQVSNRGLGFSTAGTSQSYWSNSTRASCSLM